MNYWVTADYHFNHTNIIKYCNRPFKNVDEMNETIIKRHNELVSTDDVVYFVGDFCFHSLPGEWIRRLNGTFVFILGNHDGSIRSKIESMDIRYRNQLIHLTHEPMNARCECINFVGHVHEKWTFKNNQINTILINIGVDVWDFKPVKISQALDNYKIWEKFGDRHTI